jgi:predicted RNase H-like nuclease (RuvC/YqgF family)
MIKLKKILENKSYASTYKNSFVGSIIQFVLRGDSFDKAVEKAKKSRKAQIEYGMKHNPKEEQERLDDVIQTAKNYLINSIKMTSSELGLNENINDLQKLVDEYETLNNKSFAGPDDIKRMKQIANELSSKYNYDITNNKSYRKKVKFTKSKRVTPFNRKRS